MAYGDKKDYRQIEIYRGGKLVAVTTRARNPKVARNKYSEESGFPLKGIKAIYAPEGGEENEGG